MESKNVFAEDEYYESLDAKVFDSLDLTKLYSGLKDTDQQRELVVVPKDKRRTSHIMTQAEYTAVLSVRAMHLQSGATPFVDPEDEHDHVKIAEKEILQNRCPMSISRMHSNGFMVEIWDVNEMVLPST